jgi:energy-coupling factor transport system permease protein
MTQSFEVYLPRASWLHRLDPRTKLWSVILAGAAALLLRQIAVLFALLVLTHLTLALAQIPAGRLRWLWARLAPLLVVILILQPLFAPGPGGALLEVGPVRLTAAGILVGISFALRAAALTFLSALLLLTTRSSDLVQGLVALGLPYTWGLAVGLSMRYLSTIYHLFLTVRDAQEARGLILSRGNFVQRARAHVPILVATIIAALRLGDNLGLALAARGLGYPTQRTTLHSLSFGSRDWFVVILVGLAFAGAMVARFGFGFGRMPW